MREVARPADRDRLTAARSPGGDDREDSMPGLLPDPVDIAGVPPLLADRLAGDLMETGPR